MTSALLHGGAVSMMGSSVALSGSTRALSWNHSRNAAVTSVLTPARTWNSKCYSSTKSAGWEVRYFPECLDGSTGTDVPAPPKSLASSKFALLVVFHTLLLCDVLS